MPENFSSGNEQSPNQGGSNKERPDAAEGIMSRLNKDFVLIGRTRVHTWYAWLAVGVAVGIAMGIILVANRSGEVEPIGAEILVIHPDTLEDLTLDLLEVSDEIETKKAADAEASSGPDGTGTGEQVLGASTDVSAAVAKAVGIAKRRKQILESRLSQDRALDVLKIALPKDLRDAMPLEVQPYLETEVAPTGELESLHADYADGTAKFIHNLKTSSGRLALHFAGVQPQDAAPAKKLKTGAKVKVSGVKIGEQLAVAAADSGIQVLAAPSVSNNKTFGDSETLVMLVNFSDRGGVIGPASANSVVFSGSTSVNNFYQEQSYNQASLSGMVVGPYTIPHVGTICGYDSIYTMALSAAQAAGVNTGQYVRHIVNFPSNQCAWWGLATIGGSPSISWINGSFQNSVVSHEMGHNFGLYHSHALECGSASLASSCTSIEYGDYADTMGYASPVKHFNAAQKERLGWLNYNVSPPITNVTSNGTYTITAYELPGSTPHALKIPAGGFGSFFWAEFRQPTGFDAAVINSSPSLGQGAIVHLMQGTANGSYLLDMTPETSSWSDAALPLNRSFTDQPSNVRITPLSINTASTPASMTISVTTGSVSTCARQNPSIAISPLGQYGNSGQALSYTVTVINNDASSCTPSTFSLTGAGLPSGWSLPQASVVVAPGASANTAIVITSPISATAGSYSFTETATNQSDQSKTATSISAAYNVQPAPPPPPPPPPGTAFSDDFQRADSADIGNGWQEVLGGFGIAKGEGRNDTGVAESMIIQASITGPQIFATSSFAITSRNVGVNLGIVLRYQNSQNYYYFYRSTGGSSCMRIAKVVGGVQTSLKNSKGTSCFSLGNPGYGFFQIGAAASGSKLSIYLNGKRYGEVQDSAFSDGASGIKIGTGSKSASSWVSHRADSFSASTGGGVPPPPPPGGTNNPPSVNAGPDINTTETTVGLSGTASDDGKPNPPGVLTTTWIKVSGPGTAVFAVSQTVTNVTFSSGGTYTLRLTANDGALSASDDVSVTVVPPNNPPTANAGPDQTGGVGSPITLTGSGSDDGKPNPPGVLTYSWSKISGPGTVSFGNAGAAVTTATFSSVGSYVLRLTANDSQLSATDDVSVIIESNDFSDDFNRADSTNLGSGWQEVSGGFHITSNELKSESAQVNNILLVAGEKTAPEKVVATFTSTNNNGGPALGVVLRYLNASTYYYVHRQMGGSAMLRITKVINGTETILASAALGNSTVPFTLTAEIKGSTITAKVGSVAISANDGALTDGFVGIKVKSGGNEHTIDNFSFTDKP